MNWRMTEPNKTARFKVVVPMWYIVPYPLVLLDDMQLEIHDMHDVPHFM
jgi:hypothetical protein